MYVIRAEVKLPAFLLALSVIFLSACSDGQDGADVNRAGQCDDLLILTAMPAELAPLLDAVDITDTFKLGDRVLYGANRGGHRLLLGMTGIGLVNARQMSALALENFPVRALLYSGVAGSTHRIGDVVIAEQWLLSGGSATRPVDGRLLQAARAIVDSPLSYQRCTPYPLDPPGEAVCLEHEPRLIVGGTGRSADPFGGERFACTPGGDDVFGCAPANAPGGEPLPIAPNGSSQGDALVALPDDEAAGENHPVQLEDMESAMALEVAGMFNVPAIAVRSVSDGAGDPLDLTGFFEQFFAYYRLAAGNAALATLALYDHVVAECAL